MTILVDIGGTYARFAIAAGNHLEKIWKTPASDFSDFISALSHYKKAHDVADTKILISTAAHPDGNIWRFVNANTWTIDTAELKKSGYDVPLILNDFEALAWGLSESAKKPACVLGAGTGLGLAYIRTSGVQKTFGGHIAASAVTEEQKKIITGVAATKSRPGHVVYEDLLSGFGLENIHAALTGQRISAAEIIGNVASHNKTIALFQEFLALFAAGCLVVGDAFGGLYLTGGVVDRLFENGLFDLEKFKRDLAEGYVPSVHKALLDTPVHHVVNSEEIALRGLLFAHKLKI